MVRQVTLEQHCKISYLARSFSVPDDTAPAHNTIYAIRGKFLKTGSVLDKSRSRTPAITTSDENTELLEQEQSQGSLYRALHWNCTMWRHTASLQGAETLRQV